MLIEKKQIIFVASNINQVRIWSDITKELKEKNSDIRVSLCSLGLYYGQIQEVDLRALKNMDICVLPRIFFKDFYWDTNIIKKLIMYFEALLHVSSFLGKTSPSLIVLGNDTGFLEKILIATSRRKKILTLLVQDGILRRNLKNKKTLLSKFVAELQMRISYFPGGVYGMGKTDKKAVMGPYTRKLFEEQGTEPAEIVETGHPCFDRLLEIKTSLSQSEIYERRKNMGLPIDQPVISFISQPLLRYQYLDEVKWTKIVSDVISVGLALSEKFCFVIRLHPSEIKQDFLERFGSHFDRYSIIFSQDEAISEFLPLVDVVVIYNSTLSLEAMFLDIPVIIYNPYYSIDDFCFIELGAATLTKNKQELKKALFSYQDPLFYQNSVKGRLDGLKYHIGEVRGGATKRIVNLIMEMLSVSRL